MYSIFSAFSRKRKTPRNGQQHHSLSKITHQGDRTWTPVWLGRPILLALFALFVACDIALLVLLLLSRRSRGIVAVTDIHYAWTYAPTAFFIILTAFWRQVDYHCKQLMPWTVLYRCETTAGDGLLLDYISTIQPAAFWSSLRNRHIPVIASSVGFLVLKALTVISTALTTSSLIDVTTDDSTVSKYSFTDALVGDFGVTSIGSGATYEALGVSSQDLARRYGLGEEFIYETIELPSGASARFGSLLATTRALVPEFECQSAPFRITFPPSNTTDFNPETRIELLFPECVLRGGDGRGTVVYSLNPSITRVPERQLSPLRQRIDCLNQTTEHWELLTLVDFRYQQQLSANDNDAEIGDSVTAVSWFTSVEATAGIACRSGYEVREASLSFNTSDDGAMNLLSTALSTVALHDLNNLTSADVGDLVDSAFLAASTIAGRFTDNSFEEDYPNAAFKLMTAIFDGSYAALLNESVLIDAAEQTYQQVAIQALDRHLRSNVSVSSPATCLTSERRLFMNDIATIIAIVGLSLLTSSTAVLLYTAPRGVVEHDPGLLINAGLTLRRSPGLEQMMLEAKLQNRKLKQALAGFHFASSLGYTQIAETAQAIFASKDTNVDSESQSKANNQSAAASPEQVRWYRPLSTRPICLTIFLILCPAIVASLEASQQASDRNIGLAMVSNPNDQIVRLLPQVLAAAVMLCVAAAFSSIEFNVHILYPARSLKHDAKASVDGLWLNYLGGLPISVLLSSIMHCHWAVFLATVGALTGSFLTIVSSGLYTFEDLAMTQPATAQPVDEFDIVWPQHALKDGNAAIISSLVESTNLGYPDFTYDELVLPMLQSSTNAPSAADLNSLLEVDMPAIRASLDCTTLDPSQYNFSTSLNSRILTPRAELSASVLLPSDCQRGGQAGNESTLAIDLVVPMTSNASYIGRLLDLHVGPWEGATADSTGELDPRRQPNNPSSCPTLAFIYGHASLDTPTQTAATILICYQQLHTLSTRTTFTLPNMSISIHHPPTIQTNTPPTPLLYPNTTSPNLPYRPQLHFANTFRSLDQFAPQSPRCSFRAPTAESRNMTFDDRNPALDPFFQGVLCAKQTYLPVETLALTDTTSQTRVFDSIQAFYRRYMAIAVSKNMRVPLASLSSSPNDQDNIANNRTFNGTILNARKETRLVQQSTPKWILQGMLAAMTLLGAMSVWLSRLWEPVVQWNPCTVAGQMAIWAGSGLSDDGLKGWETGGGKTAGREEFVRRWAGWRFRLGWIGGSGAGIGDERERREGMVWTIYAVREGPESRELGRGKRAGGASSASVVTFAGRMERQRSRQTEETRVVYRDGWI